MPKPKLICATCRETYEAGHICCPKLLSLLSVLALLASLVAGMNDGGFW